MTPRCGFWLQRRRPRARNGSAFAPPLAPWELRPGKYRVFYEVVEGSKVRIVAIGHREHSGLFIRGERVEL